MARVLINEDTLKSLGEVVRGKTDKSTKLTPSQLVTEIQNNLYGMKTINENDYNNLGTKKDMLYLIPAESVGSTSNKKYRAVPGSVDVTVICDDIDSGIFISQYFNKSIDTLTVTAGSVSVFNSPQDIAHGKYLDVKKIILDNTITDIGVGAFSGLTRLEEVELHINYSNTKRYTYSYQYWSGGIKYTGYDNVDLYTFNTGTFDGCTALYKVTIEDDSNINGLPPQAFKNHPSLVEFESKKQYLIVLEEAFYGCANLAYVKGNLSFYDSSYSGQANVATDVFYGCIRLKYMSGLSENYDTVSRCSKIPFDNGFENCHSLTNVTLDTSVVASNLFKGSKNLTNVVVNGALEIQTSAFENITSLKSFTFNNTGYHSDVIIGTDAFKGCTGLTTVDLSDSYLTELSAGAFSGCTALKNLNLSLPSLVDINSDVDNSPFKNSGIQKINLTDSNITVLYYTFAYATALNELKLPTTLTAIKSHAFDHCGLTTLNMPSSVNTLGSYAFENSNIQTINWGSAVITTMETAVFQHSSLLEFTVPSMITDLGNYCFRYAAIQEITIHDAVTSIPLQCFKDSTIATINLTNTNTLDIINESAFSGCSHLTSLDFTKFKVSNIKSSAFSSSGITSLDFSVITKPLIVDSQAFLACYHLASIDLDSSYSLTIRSAVFSNCSSLTSITFPSTTSNINLSSATELFKGCTGLTTVTIPTPFTSLPANMFEGCSNLTSIELPDTLTIIPAEMFMSCIKLDTITTPTNTTSLGLPTNLVTIGPRAFAGTKLAGVIDIPDTITTSISAFKGCRYITKVILRKPSINVLASSYNIYAFENCTSLTEVRFYIPSGYTNFTKIPSGCFKGCTSLTTVYIPETVTSIDSAAFQNCTSLSDIYFAGTQAQWESITISSSDNTALNNATIHYETV